MITFEKLYEKKQEYEKQKVFIEAKISVVDELICELSQEKVCDEIVENEVQENETQESY